MNNLVLGGASLAAGYVGASLLKPMISHHSAAGCPKDCTKLNCTDVLSGDCDIKCNQNGGLNATIAKCQRGSSVLMTSPKNKISQKDIQGNISCGFLDFECYQRSGPNNLGSTGVCPSDPVACFAGLGCGGIFTQVPVLGQAPCWAIILGAVGLIFLAPAISRIIK